jgi:cytochrome c-type biogenesis protein CcmH/NrfG
MKQTKAELKGGRRRTKSERDSAKLRKKKREKRRRRRSSRSSRSSSSSSSSSSRSKRVESKAMVSAVALFGAEPGGGVCSILNYSTTEAEL